MNVDEVRTEVDRIIKDSWDCEKAHGSEDELLVRLVREYCPPRIVAEVDRLADAEFPRHCA